MKLPSDIKSLHDAIQNNKSPYREIVPASQMGNHIISFEDIPFNLL